MAADGWCGVHPKPPLTQPTTFPLPSATERGHLKPGGKRVQLSVCKRKTTGCSRREERQGRSGARQGPESHVKSEKQERGRDEISEGERGEQSERPRERATDRDMLARVQGYHWQKSRHLPAASWRQQHSARRMLPCATSVCWCARLCLCVCPSAQHGGCRVLRAPLMC